MPDTSPLALGLGAARVPDPALMVIFGATGDLSRRKLLPSLYNLARQRVLPTGFAVVGAALDKIDDEQFRELADKAVREHSRRRGDVRRLRQLRRRLPDGRGGRPGVGP